MRFRLFLVAVAAGCATGCSTGLFAADEATSPTSIQRSIVDSDEPLDPQLNAGGSQYVRDRDSVVTLKRPGTTYADPARAAWVTKTWSKEHTNATQGYSIALPDWLELDPKTSAKSRTMRFTDGEIRLTLHGATQATDPKTLLDVRSMVEERWRQKSAQIAESEFEDQTHTATGHRDKEVFFQRTWVGEDTRVTMIWTYPQEYREYMSDIVTRAARVFNPGELTAKR